MQLRPLLPEDQPHMVRMLTDKMIAKTFMLPVFSDSKEAETLFRRMMDLSNDSQRYVRGICEAGQLVGFLNETEVQEDTIELGYVVDSAHHGKGYMTCALKLAMEELFAIGFRRVVTGAFSGNLASIRVMEKCGMHRLEKTETVAYRGENHLCVFYAMDREEMKHAAV